MPWLRVSHLRRPGSGLLVREPHRCVCSREMCLSSTCSASCTYPAKDARMFLFQSEPVAEVLCFSAALPAVGPEDLVLVPPLRTGTDVLGRPKFRKGAQRPRSQADALQQRRRWPRPLLRARAAPASDRGPAPLLLSQRRFVRLFSFCFNIVLSVLPTARVPGEQGRAGGSVTCPGRLGTRWQRRRWSPVPPVPVWCGPQQTVLPVPGAGAAHARPRRIPAPDESLRSQQHRTRLGRARVTALVETFSSWSSSTAICKYILGNV